MAERPDVLWCLDNVDLFRHLSLREREALRQRVKTLRYQRGEAIFLPGDPGNTVYFLRRGQVRLDYLDHSGRRLTLKICRRGEPFGEAALAGEAARRLLAEAQNQVELCAIDRDDLMAFALSNPGLSLRLSKLIGLRLVELENRIEDLFFKSVPTRLARLLLKLDRDAGAPGADLEVKLTHQDLADLIGARRETVSLVLGGFEDQGRVAKRHGRLRVLDRDRLRALAEEV